MIFLRLSIVMILDSSSLSRSGYRRRNRSQIQQRKFRILTRKSLRSERLTRPFLNDQQKALSHELIPQNFASLTDICLRSPATFFRFFSDASAIPRKPLPSNSEESLLDLTLGKLSANLQL
jgi:hypothetical protein